MKIVGLDLSGMEKNDTGFCFLGNKIETKLLHTDQEILDEIDKISPDLIAVDAPFSFPVLGTWRPGEATLIKRGFRPVNTRIPSMALLVDRAIALVAILRKKYQVIEVYSAASERLLGLSKEPRKNKDEYEALLCALTGKAYLEGEYENLDGIIVPK
jgi:uncharacterized protein